jgi:hypothetical protein
MDEESEVEGVEVDTGEAVEEVEEVGTLDAKGTRKDRDRH